VCRAGNPGADPQHWTRTRTPEVVRAVAVPWRELGRDGGAALLSVLATTGVGLLFLRRSTDLPEVRAT
jgi:hypothetical protein